MFKLTIFRTKPTDSCAAETLSANHNLTFAVIFTSNQLTMNRPYMRKFLFNNARMKHTWIKPEGYDTGIQVYNCLAKEKVPLIVRNKNFTTWYTCGPTVYDSAHIGHASCYVKLDIIQRILRSYFKINLITVMNITDVDDKIIKKSLQAKESPMKIAQHYEKEFFEDMESLKIIKPNVTLRVTENMGLIENFMKRLLEKKYAFKSDDGSVVFDLKTIGNYGKLQNINQKDSTQADSEVNFAVWKAAKENEPFWESAYGSGRPGWHTECSALASAIFGSTVDIHAGGIDLRFPHHENEEAQCCSYFSKPQWVNYWFHTGHLLQNSTKMSKSLNNTVNIRNMLQMCSADVFRVMCLMSRYRHNMELSEEYVKSAEKLLESYKNFVGDCNACITGKLNPIINKEILNVHLTESVNKVHSALTDEFDTASCIKIINSLIATTNKMLHSSATNINTDLSGIGCLISVLNFVVNTLNLFGIDLNQKLSVISEHSDTTELINIVTEFRQRVRTLGITNKDKLLLQLCDDVRNDLKKYGITVKDHGKLSSWS